MQPPSPFPPGLHNAGLPARPRSEEAPQIVAFAPSPIRRFAHCESANLGGIEQGEERVVALLQLTIINLL